MNDISKQVIDNHMKRMRYKSKSKFVDFMQHNFENAQVDTHGKVIKSRNIILGDADKAKVMFSAHYDTPAIMPFPNFITPKNLFVFIAYQLILSVFFAGIMFALAFLLKSLTQTYIVPYIDLSNPLVGVILAFLLGALPFLLSGAIVTMLLLAGFSNPNNYNDNTSGVVTLIELYSQMTQQQRDKCLFVFFDNEEKGMLGSSAFKQKYKHIASNTLVINFDCVGDGDNIFFFGKKTSKEFETTLIDCIPNGDNDIQNKKFFVQCKGAVYPSDNMQFKKSFGVCALNKAKFIGYYVSRLHMPFDKKLDHNNIIALTQMCINLTNSSLGDKE